MKHLILIVLFCIFSVTSAQQETPAPPAQPNPMTGNALMTQQLPFSEDLFEQLQLPEGFTVNVFASDLGNPRMIAVAPDGTIFISRRATNDVIALFDGDQNGISDVEGGRVVASNLELAHGLTIHDGRLYIATATEIYAADLLEDGTLGTPELLVEGLPDPGQHPNKTLAFGPDGMLYVTVGSLCNACGTGEDEQALIYRFNPVDWSKVVYARGLRNTIGFDWHPVTGELWGMDHGTDWRGDNTPPEELNLIEPDHHYGWPFCFGNQQVDEYLPQEPANGMNKEEFCATTTTPVLDYTAHSAPIGMIFYTGDHFPEDYHNDAFVVMRGSWNRNPPSGYKVARLTFDDNGQPEGFEDFLTGFLIEDQLANFARLAGIAIAADGSLLITDDTNGMVYRVAYNGE